MRVSGIDISDYGVREDMIDLADANNNVEFAYTMWGNISHTGRIDLKMALEYQWASKSTWEVSYDLVEQQKTHRKVLDKGYTVVAEWHDHLAQHNHAHDFSTQDKQTIKEQIAPTHILAYKELDGSLRLKAVDTTMKPVPFYVNGTCMDIVTIFTNASVQEYKEAGR